VGRRAGRQGDALAAGVAVAFAPGAHAGMIAQSASRWESPPLAGIT
jgi:hypothetical protein